MGVLRACFGIYAVIIAVVYVVMLPVSAAVEHSSFPAPAPAPTSDGYFSLLPSSLFIASIQNKIYSFFFVLIRLAISYVAGTTIDQGIAYILMLLALALTYIIH